MSLGQLIIGWFYYGIFYMGLSIMATVIINRVAKRYFTAPLIINAFGVVALAVMLYLKQFTGEQFLTSVLFVYMPIVAASAVFNFVLWLIRRRQPLHDLPLQNEEGPLSK
ncbi:hypothetical protein I4Q36_06755 [Tuanshanicoccus lijuaniae]|uniref:hypothetical protein n=1 Tax=Aerococcaceae bacterium zg-1292 TaxID=2774330 RepID=UPI001936C396|nr:hypothetical protein [Aerococcaceae bacterium zg-1292]MBF6626668.1 hypothetical protein [Aerococcaceae bacterium zg-BR9]MBF6977621.1 hypothetical protein [Aerococcaceae bacterium zg-BR22]MBS4456986.1 hypothetical protein [Aerococcaceae bacterium zg-A91]MBS4458836.1 hypothetical protein [Aerococcaceae bacterium zg-BR33]